MSEYAKSESSTLVQTRPAPQGLNFDHHRLDAFHVALEALFGGSAQCSIG